MNPIWLDFLNTFPFSEEKTERAIYAVTGFKILQVSGADATQFLQGQITCNIKELQDNNSFFAALCNPKGRVISTFLLLKSADAFLLILPAELFEKVKTTLQKYIMRAKVQLQDVSELVCLTGMACDDKTAAQLTLPTLNFSVQNQWVKLATTYYLHIASVTESLAYCASLFTQGFLAKNAAAWQVVNINVGFAWLTQQSSEVYIPQMLNLDKLAGISFTKGCYTGQEIIARTHYLGQAKREMFLAQIEGDFIPPAELPEILAANGQTVGQILSLQNNDLLAILQSNAVTETGLTLNDAHRTSLKIIPFI